MTTIDEQAGTARTDGLSDASAQLSRWPWNALRPARGMLLDSDDFDVMLGNPRGKHMLHNAWLHGSGVVWGFSVETNGEWELKVSPGLGLDGIGRELHLDADRCISVQGMLDKAVEDCRESTVEFCLMLSFDACLDRPVPALADPCDVTRESQEYSRINERAHLHLARGHHRVPRSYGRVRVLLGLDHVRDGDEAGKEALAARNEVMAAPAHDRAPQLLRWFRCLAARDAADLSPTGDVCEPDLFPVDDADAGICLACIRVKVRNQSGCAEIDGDMSIDDCCRRALLPTTVIQDLVCALAPGLIGTGDPFTGVGPQAVPGSIEWGHHPRELSFRVTADVLPATLTRDSVLVSSLSPAGWVVEDLDRRPRYDAHEKRIIVRLADRPAHPLIRVLVIGTGVTPVYGAEPPVPFAGLVGDDPGTTGQGRDAVVTADNPYYETPHDHGRHHEHDGHDEHEHEHEKHEHHGRPGKPRGPKSSDGEGDDHGGDDEE